MSLLGAVMGAVIALIASDTQSLWIVMGAVIGLVAGYFLGKGIDNTTAKK
jgi:ABC-type dipeptide/oligopeptide/nickel transport system permease subunit